MSSEPVQEVFQVIDEENLMCGLFTTLKHAQNAVKILLKDEQNYRIPLNQIGPFSECYDVIETYNSDKLLLLKK